MSQKVHEHTESDENSGIGEGPDQNLPADQATPTPQSNPGLPAKAKKSLPERIFTVDEACDYLRISKSTIDRYRRSGAIHAVKLGGRCLFSSDEILRFLNANLQKDDLKEKNDLKIP